MADNNLNFSFDLNDFNKGIDDIQKKIQQMSNALKAATDPKTIDQLTVSIYKANTQLKEMKNNLAAVSTEANNISSLSTALDGSFNIATTSLDAMVTGSQQLIDKLKMIQGMAAIQFTQNIKQQPTTQAPAGGVSFGGGADAGYERLSIGLKDLSSVMAKASSYGNDFNKAMAGIEGTISNLTNEFSTLSQSTRYYSDEIERLKGGIFNLEGAIGAAQNLGMSYDKEELQLANLQIRLQEVEKEYEQLTRARALVNDELTKSLAEKNRIQNEEASYLSTVSSKYAELSKEYYTARVKVLDYQTAINELETMKAKDIALTDQQIDALERYKAELADAEGVLSNYQDRKNKIEAAVGGSGKKSGFQNELFSVQQILREMPAFTYSIQTGFLALSNNIPILIDDFGRMSKAVDSTTGKSLGFWKTLGMMGKEAISFTGITTILVSVLTVFGPMLWNWITGTKELTEAQKALNKETEGIAKKYNDLAAEVEKFVALLDKGVISIDNQYSSLVQLEKLIGIDMTSAYSKLGNSIKDATDLQELFILELQKAEKLEINAAARESKRKDKMDAEKALYEIAKDANAEQKKLMDYIRTAPSGWAQLVLENKAPMKYVKEGKLKMDDLKEYQKFIQAYNKLIDQAPAFSKMEDLPELIFKAVDATDKYNKELNKSIELNKGSNLPLKERIQLTKDNMEMNILNAEASLKEGQLTSEKATQIRKEALKTQLKELNILAKDFENEVKDRNADLDKQIAESSSQTQKKSLKEKKIEIKNEGKWILTEQKKVQAELNKAEKEGRNKNKKDREKSAKEFVEKEANIERELLEDYQGIQKLRLQLIKDSYEKESLIISQKYNELDVKAKQRHEDEMKTLKDAFATRKDFQEREYQIEQEFQSKTKGKTGDVVEKQREIAVQKRAQLKKDIDADFKVSEKYQSQMVRSTDFMNRTIYLNHKNLYDELLKLANKYALDREAFNRTFDKNLLLKNIITNEETLKIEKQQLENLYNQLEQIREKRAFTFFEKPKETSIFVDFQDEAFKFTQEDLPKIKSLLDNLLKTNPADRMVGVYQLAIENLKGKTVDVYNIFKETEDKMEVLIKQMNKDLEGITDPVEKKKIEDKYKDLTKLAKHYADALKEINENNKPVVKAEDVEKFNSLMARMITLNQMMKDAKADLEVANQEEGTRNVDVKNYISSLQTQLNEVNKELESIKIEPISIQDIPKEAFKKAVAKLNEELQKDPNATIDIVPNSDIILNKFRNTLDDAKSAMKDGDMPKFNELLKKAFSISESIQKKLTPEEKKQLQDSMDTIYNEAVAVLEQQLDTKKAEIVKKAADKSGFNTEGVPKEFKRSEMWRQDKVNEDIEKAELEHERKVLQIKISTNKATEEEIIAFHKKEMDLIQKQKTRLANAIGDIANAVGDIFQSTLDTISQYIQNANDLANERLALQQAISDNIISGYDREIEKIKLMMDTQQMSDAERINGAQQIRDLERQKFYEETQMKIKALELQKKQIETNKKLALAQAAISGGVALANVVRIATEGAVGTGPAAPFVFAASLAAGIASVGSAVLSAKQAIESSDAQIATIDAQIAGLNSAYVDGLNKSNSAISSGAAGSGPSAPLTTFNADLVNTGQSNANYNVNDTLKGYKIYVTQADIQNANNQVTKISKKITFG